MFDLQISSDELNLTHTLTRGQAFRWKEDGQGRWTGVVRGRVVTLWREGNNLKHEVVPKQDGFLEDYFRLDVRLEELYREFRQADENVSRAIDRFKGLRVLRQEPEETLLSYVCSTANSVSRITNSIEQLSKRYGERIEGTPAVAEAMAGRDYYSFPTAEALAKADPDELAKSRGLGFRAANLSCVARQLIERPEGWLESLRRATYEEARRELTCLRCVGMKIADCVLLFSLNKDQAVPVDTHIRHIAVRNYLPEFMQKTLTQKVYRQIGDLFRQKFGPYAGWAQEYLYYDDLLRHSPQERIL